MVVELEQAEVDAGELGGEQALVDRLEDLVLEALVGLVDLLGHDGPCVVAARFAVAAVAVVRALEEASYLFVDQPEVVTPHGTVWLDLAVGRYINWKLVRIFVSLGIDFPAIAYYMNYTARP